MIRIFVVMLAALIFLATAGCVISPLPQGENEDGAGNPVDMLAGTWSLPCRADSTGSHYILSWKFSGGKFLYTDAIYDTLDCSSDPASATSYHGTYATGGPLITPNGYYCVEVDFDYGDPGIRYDIFRVAGSYLYFGDPATGSGLTLEDRPAEIDLDNIYDKQ